MRTYMDYTNRRGNKYGVGMAHGGSVHLRGWDIGIRLVARAPKDGPDSFDVFMTTGSHESGADVLIGTAINTPDGPEFKPAEGITAKLAGIERTANGYSNGVTS